MRKTCCIMMTSILFNFYSIAYAQRISNFKADGNSGKQERIENVEKYLTKVSSSLNLIDKKLKKSSGSEFRKLQKRLDKLERSQSGNGGCCKLVNKTNLPKLEGDAKAAKRKIKELETKTDKLKANEIMILQAEVQLLKKSIESLKKLIFEKLKAQK
ncbi:MAG: hypothetical protein HN576_06605 [Bacteriovoracaceae bacterium]|jgi:hypothetical protein|nr:hypothetical protein [Bacteriovoracaceae bacterium]